MYKLEEMIAWQVNFQKKLYPGFNPLEMTYEEKVELTKKYCLYLHEEVSEVMQSLKYKDYHKYDKIYDEESTKVEIIDCLKFVLNLAILWGMPANEIKNIFDLKSIENLKRITPHE